MIMKYISFSLTVKYSWKYCTLQSGVLHCNIHCQMVTHSDLATSLGLQISDLTVDSLLVLFNGEDVMAVVFLQSSCNDSLLVVVCYVLVVPWHWHWVW